MEIALWILRFDLICSAIVLLLVAFDSREIGPDVEI